MSMENKMLRCFPSRPNQLCLWKIKTQMTPWASFCFCCLLFYFRQDSENVSWKALEKHGSKKKLSFLDLYSFMLWNCLGSGFGSHLWLFPFASSISKHSCDLVFSLMWEPKYCSCLVLAGRNETITFMGKSTWHRGKEADRQTQASDDIPVGICEFRK